MPIAARYTQNPDFIYRKIVDEMVLVPIHHDVNEMECLYTLNEVGAFIWEQLREPAAPADLHAALLAEYEVDAQEAALDLGAYLEDLAAIGAVTKV